MQKFKYSLLTAAGILVLAFVLSVVGPKRVMAALGYTPIRDVDNPARQPFMYTSTVPINDGRSEGYGSFPVPAGKRLVVETMTVFRDNARLGQSVQVLADVEFNGQIGYFALPFVSATTARLSCISQSTRLYADPGTNVSFDLLRTGSSGNETDVVTVWGYLVNLP